MKWKQMLFTIVLNIFLMLFVSIALEYSDLTERFVSIEDTVQEALDLAISASVHSEEFFSAEYQGKLQSYAGVESGGGDETTTATTLVWLQNEGRFAQVNTYQFAQWFMEESYETLPESSADVNSIMSIGYGPTDRYGLSGHVFEWLYGGAGSDYNNPSLFYANKNTAKRIEYSAEGSKANGSYRNRANDDFRAFYNGVGNLQHTVGYLKLKVGEDSYKLELTEYPVLCNMGLSWMDTNLNGAGALKTSDNLCSSLHIGKSRLSSLSTYYFLTPTSLGVTYIPVEVLKPVFVANLDTIIRLNKLGASSNKPSTIDAVTTLRSASDCIETSVWDFNGSEDRYEDTNGRDNLDPDRHAVHESLWGEKIVTDGLVEFDLDTVQVKVDYFWHDFNSGGDDSAILISKLNGTLSDTGVGGVSNEHSLRQETLNAFINQDSGEGVSDFLSSSYWGEYESVGKSRIVARVTAKVKVHVPYKSAILQWASYMFTGTNHFDIKMFDPENNRADLGSDGLWYQYTTYFCTSRS